MRLLVLSSCYPGRADPRRLVEAAAARPFARAALARWARRGSDVE